MSVLYPLIQALVLFAVAPLLSGVTRVARARLHNRRGPGVLQEYRDIIKLLGRQRDVYKRQVPDVPDLLVPPATDSRMPP